VSANVTPSRCDAQLESAPWRTAEGVDVGKFRAGRVDSSGHPPALAPGGDREGETSPTWQQLDESRKNSNRDQARHIPIHLHKVGCAIAPLKDLETQNFPFTDHEITLLSIAEHDRWNRERIADGWNWPLRKTFNGSKPRICCHGSS
jgi:hypothetical protein